MAGPPSWRTRISKAPTARSIRPSRATRPASRCCSGSSRFPAASRATSSPETPGSIHEGGELGYSLSHAFGAVFDNPDLIVACVVGDGEAETGPLATAWHSNKFLNPDHRRRRAADPPFERLQDRQPDRARAHPARGARASCFAGYGWDPLFVEGDDPAVDAPAHGADARSRCRANPRHSRTGAISRQAVQRRAGR